MCFAFLTGRVAGWIQAIAKTLEYTKTSVVKGDSSGERDVEATNQNGGKATAFCGHGEVAGACEATNSRYSPDRR